MRNKVILGFLVIFLIAGNLFAAGVGTTGAQFLKIDPAARPIGLGGAFSAVVDDSNAVFYNPAGLARQKKNEISGTYLSYFQSINYGSLAVVRPLSIGSIGLGINYLGVTDIQKRGLIDLDDPDGTVSPGTFGASDAAVTISFARQNAVPSLLENLDLGVNVRFIYSVIDDESAFSTMLDLGSYYPVNEKFAIALTLQNIGTNVKFKDESDPLPLNLKVGAAYKPIRNLLIASDINEYVIDQVFYVSLGAEYWIMDVIAIRAGYKYGYDTDKLGSSVGLSGGGGFRLFGLGLDYAFAPFGDLGDTHRVSFSATF